MQLARKNKSLHSLWSVEGIPNADKSPFSSPEAALLLVSTKNRDLWLHSGQTTGHSHEHARGLRTSGHFPSSSHKISTVNLRFSSHLGTKFNHSAPPNVLFPSFTALATGFLIRKSSPRETNDNYRDKNTSRHVSLRQENSLLLQR